MVQPHRLRGIRHSALALTLLCSALALVPGPAQARHPGLNLHDMPDSQFLHMLDVELGDDDLEACGFHDLNQAHTTQEAYDAVICALGDEYDQGEETLLDFDDLVYEMEQDGTTVEKVVREAIAEADRRAGGAWNRVVLLAALRAGLASEVTDTGLDAPEWYAQIQNGLIKPPTANIKTPVKEGLNRARK